MRLIVNAARIGPLLPLLRCICDMPILIRHARNIIFFLSSIITRVDSCAVTA